VGLRRDLLRLDDHTDAYRVLHAEADGTSGLVVDRYGDVLSAEIFALPWAPRIDDTLSRLGAMLGTKHTVVKAGPATLAQEGFELEPRASEACPQEILVTEFGTKFRVRFTGGHKTGFFCDQREHRQRLASLAGGKSVLDLCCYTGGFAVQAKKLGGAAEVVGVDLDAGPLELAKANANLNQAQIKFAQADAFAYLRDLEAVGKRFDVVVLDPPKLIRSRLEYDEGLRKHHDLNRLAMKAVAPGGVLLTCSCAGLLPDEEFFRMVAAAARGAERQLRIFHVGGAAADHPILSVCPETRYLKAIWAIVD
jgi:23S rRNA (cytosine1962-C5)-methyltransferase